VRLRMHVDAGAMPDQRHFVPYQQEACGASGEGNRFERRGARSCSACYYSARCIRAACYSAIELTQSRTSPRFHSACHRYARMRDEFLLLQIRIGTRREIAPAVTSTLLRRGDCRDGVWRNDGWGRHTRV
jgi:hypothetical protein